MSLNPSRQAIDRCKAPRLELIRTGPLAKHLEGFTSHLLREGYSDGSFYKKSLLIRALNRWLIQHNLSLENIDEARLQQFLSDRQGRLSGGVRRREANIGQQLLRYLRSLGSIPAPAPIVDRTALGKLMRDFERFLRSERGLSPATITGYQRCVRRFLAGRFRGRALNLQHLRARDLDRFILREARRLSPISAKAMLVALRCFLRYALQRGWIKADLAMSVPKVASWRYSHLPKSLTPDQVERLLASCDYGTPDGLRNHAILLLLARLGLRAKEVSTLRLEDLDWDHGEIVVRTKMCRIHHLPLTKEIGSALARYLRHGRPHCPLRTVFVRQRPPWSALSSSGVGQIVRRALRCAGLKPERTGAHLLRHSLATNMLRKGASLHEIGQMLGHECPTTTQIYAKVDIKALRTIAMPWMGRPA
jgi:site-specific recombinase XerD